MSSRPGRWARRSRPRPASWPRPAVGRRSARCPTLPGSSRGQPARTWSSMMRPPKRRLAHSGRVGGAASMNTTEASAPSPADKTNEAGQKYLSVRQAAFIGVGAMVGAGIFALLGAAGEVAGAAVWLSFLIAGFVAVVQGYSFAKLGARYPSAGGLLEYVA